MDPDADLVSRLRSLKSKIGIKTVKIKIKSEQFFHIDFKIEEDRLFPIKGIVSTNITLGRSIWGVDGNLIRSLLPTMCEEIDKLVRAIPVQGVSIKNVIIYGK